MTPPASINILYPDGTIFAPNVERIELIKLAAIYGMEKGITLEAQLEAYDRNDGIALGRLFIPSAMEPNP